MRGPQGSAECGAVRAELDEGGLGWEEGMNGRAERERWGVIGQALANQAETKVLVCEEAGHSLVVSVIGWIGIGIGRCPTIPK